MDQIIYYVYFTVVILISLSMHELAHGWVSYKLGDPTAKMQGRLTLNPIRHIDPLGLIMIYFLHFGWAKPVPINPLYYKDKKKGTMLVSFAGPLSNIMLAFIIAFPLVYLETKYGFSRNGFYTSNNIQSIVYNFSNLFYMLNVGLAVFNLLPIPPLDGSKILAGILPGKHYMKFMEYQQYIVIGFFILIFVLRGFLGKILSPFIWFIETAIETIVNTVLRLFM